MKTLTNFEKITKKNRRKNRLITVAVSLLTITVLGFAIFIGLSRLVGHQARKIEEQLILLEEVAYPNIESYTLTYEPTSHFSGSFNAERFKNLNGVLVEYPDYSQTYTLQGPWYNWLADAAMDKGDGEAYTYDNQQKVPQFYNTNVAQKEEVEVSQPTQELPMLAEMKGDLVEVAITFDKTYTYKEIQGMVPDNVMLNWYWIGTKSGGDSSTWRPYDLYGTDGLGWTTEEYIDQAAAEKAIKEAGDKRVEPDDKKLKTKTVDAFFTNLKAVAKESKSSYNNVSPIDDVKAYLKKFGHLDLTKESDRNQLEFSGIILTGKAEHFAQLENKEWIYASSIGASTSNQPYYQLEKD